ncbi:MAG TPA: alpha/beta hydrolase [Acidimicrobiia bacterium]
MSRARPTFVLIHGGGSSARFWDRLLPLLDGNALAVDMPGRGGKPADFATLTVDEEVASVLADIRSAVPSGPIVLVAHSSGGLLVPGLVAGLEGRVVHIVLCAALVPPEGGEGLDCMKPRHAEGLRLAAEAAAAEGTSITLPGAPEDPESARAVYGGDPLDDETLAFIVDPVRYVPDTVHHYFQPVHWSLAGSVPVTYIITERDRPIPLALQEEMLARLPHPPRIVRVDSGHLLPVTDPERFASLLEEAIS